MDSLGPFLVGERCRDPLSYLKVEEIMGLDDE